MEHLQHKCLSPIPKTGLTRAGLVVLALIAWTHGKTWLLADEPKPSQLRLELLSMMKADQELRSTVVKVGNPSKEIVARIRALDSEHTRRLKEIVAVHGWPGRTLVGRDGAHAAWLLVQHADEALEFQRKCLSLMKQLPASEIDPADVAYLTDRVLLAEGKPQVYGTQLELLNGKLQPRPIQDPVHVDCRRKVVGLPPLAEYIESAKMIYNGKDGDAGWPSR